MKGGTIKNNTVGIGSSTFPSKVAVVGDTVATARFNMYDGAVISGNKLRPSMETVNSTNIQNTDKITKENYAAVCFSNNGSFFMYGGTISGTNYRGVRMASGTTFKMEGGTIENNGKSTVLFQNENLFVRGGGLFLTGSNQDKFSITGGAIVNNGTVNSPGSGMVISSTSSSKGAVTIDGQVNFDGNEIMFSSTAKGYKGIALGPNFVNKGDNPIKLVPGRLAGATLDNLVSLNTLSVLFLSTSGDLATMKSSFVVERMGRGDTDGNIMIFHGTDELNLSIENDGKLSVSKKE
jgi:hypothetical protein